MPGIGESIGNALGQRHFGADYRERYTLFPYEVQQRWDVVVGYGYAFRLGGYAGVARSAVDLGDERGTAKCIDDRMFAAAAADHQHYGILELFDVECLACSLL